MLRLTLLLAFLPFAISGCTMPGQIASGLDPVEGRLVQELVQETCAKLKIVDQDDNVIRERALTPDNIAVIAMKDTPDGGRAAWIRIFGSEHKFSYHPKYAVVSCGGVYGHDYIPDYDQVSAILVERGGDPELYNEVLRQRELARQKAERKANVLDATFPIRVHWGGVSEPLVGTIREVRRGDNGTMAIDLPQRQGTCVGEYKYTGRNVGTWTVQCPDNLTASGTFKSGQGAHGEGIDSSGRKVTYTIDVGS